MKDEKIKVVYIMGCGRSGSTILNIILDNHEQIFGGGELANINEVFNDKRLCSCNKAMVSCEFWSSVVHKWLSISQVNKIEDCSNLWGKFERFKSLKAWLTVFFGLNTNSKSVELYFESVYNYFKSIKDESKKEVILDISKNPLRAWALSKNPKIDLRIIHLVRDGRGVAWSLKKTAKIEKRKRSIYRAALYWSIVNRLSEYVIKRTKNTFFFRYEDFANNPTGIIKEMEKVFDVDMSPIINKIEANDYFKINHVMEGNGIRKASNIKVKFNDDEWKTNLNKSLQNKFYYLAFSSMRRYNYN